MNNSMTRSEYKQQQCPVEYGVLTNKTGFGRLVSLVFCVLFASITFIGLFILTPQTIYADEIEITSGDQFRNVINSVSMGSPTNPQKLKIMNRIEVTDNVLITSNSHFEIVGPGEIVLGNNIYISGSLTLSEGSNISALSGTNQNFPLIFVDFDATLTMNGGVITNNVTNKTISTVGTDAGFIMNGGTISSNSNTKTIIIDNGATFTMNGGTINNSAANGVAVKVGSIPNKISTFQMNGGTINSTGTSGKAVQTDDQGGVESVITQESGTIIGPVEKRRYYDVCCYLQRQ